MDLASAVFFSLINAVTMTDIITSSEADRKEIFKLNASATAPKMNALSPFITKVTPSEKPDISPMFDGERSCVSTCIKVCGARMKKPAATKRIKLVVPVRNRNPSISGR